MKRFSLFMAFLAFFAMASHAQNDPTNLNFENWNGIEPVGWTSSNDLSMDGGGAQTVFKETASPGEGSASLKLVTGSCPECENFRLLFLPLPFPNPVGGFIQLGSVGDGGVAYNKRPVSVDFLYKARPMGDDACCFQVELTKYNAATDEDELVGECYFEVNSTVEEWTHVNIPFVYSTTQQPDKMSIFICSSVGSIPDYSAIAPGMPTPSQLGLPAPLAGSEFYIDGIVFNMPSCEGFNVTVSGTHETSVGAMDGTATATPNGGTAPYQYLWSNLETTQTITGLIPTSYYVTVTDANACQKVGNFTVNPAGCNIAVTVTGTNSNSYSIYSGTGSATATVTSGNPPYLYTWNTGAETATISNLPIGTYSVMVQEANDPGCFTWGYYTVFGPNGSGVGTELIATVRMYPNPASDQIRIEGDTRINTLSVYNANGQLVHKKRVNGSDFTLDISHFAAGLYLLKIDSENGTMEAKFVKE